MMMTGMATIGMVVIGSGRVERQVYEG